MKTRASTRTRLSVIPVFIALMFNLVVPVISIAVPEQAPAALQPQVAEAASDPEHVSFTLEGCRDPSVNLELTGFVCADDDYTTGNLGKTWNELDLVPHRLTTSVGTQDSATTTYTIGVAADFMEGGVPGYDVMGEPVINEALSDDSCQLSYSEQITIEPGVGGTDSSVGRLFTVTQDKGTTCVFDWVERLALGSHNFPGSSLHTNRTNQEWSTSGIGAADVSIPVKEILPQELSKDMTAEQGQTYGWEITKSADPSELNFANTCLDTTGARSATVEITVAWTRSGPTASGDTTITTHVYATNPAHRTITVQATDNIYEGAGQEAASLLDTVVGSAVDVPAGTSDMLILTHSFVYSGDATIFNDVATATYTDKVTGIAVPGQTTASASAETTAASGAIGNASVLVTDTESITGTGLSFSVAQPSVGAFTNYAANSSTTGPVEWAYTATESGSVTFVKTVTVDEPRVTSGSLSDTAAIIGDGSVELDSASESVEITTDALASLDISKTIPAGSLRSGESVTFDFEVAGPEQFTDTASITFTFGDPLTKSTSLTGLAPGEYTVTELPEANWADHTPQVDSIVLPDCEGSVSFNNSTLAPDLGLAKEADNETVTAGEQIGFKLTLANSDATGTGVAKDVILDDALPAGDGVDWEIESVAGIGGFDPTGLCAIAGTPPTETLECDLGDLGPGDGLTVHLVSATTGESCKAYANAASANASNHAELNASATTTVLCPDLGIEKTTTTPVVNAGDSASYTVTLSNEQGDAEATGVDLVDSLPAGLTWTDDSDDCSIADNELSCLDLTIPAGESFTVTVTGTTDSGDCPSLLNRATFTSANAGSGETAAEGQGTLITVNCPDVSVDKEPVESPISAGEEGRFTLEVTNAGPGVAYDVVVEDMPDAGTTWTVIDDAGFECSSASVGDQQTLTCTLDSLVAEASAEILIGYTTSQADCGVIDNAVTVAASNEPTANTGNNSDTASLVVECPGLNLTKTADADPIDTGDEASFTITLWNAGPGDAFDVELHDDLPAGLSWDFEVVSGDAVDEDCGLASSITEGGIQAMSIDCEFGTLEPTSMEAGIVIRVFALTDRTDCRLLENTATADGSNLQDPLTASDTILVRCPEIALEKENDTDGPVLPGTTVTYTLTLTVSDGPAEDVVVVDTLPDGLSYVDESASDDGAFNATANTITWTLGDLADGDYELTYQAVVDADAANGAELVNVAEATSPNSQCPNADTLGPECEDDSTVIVRVPTLVIDKVADADVIAITGPNGNLVATPSVVTWTLTYTLANGPVTNAVITDELPTGLEFLDASDGGTFADGTVTWTFESLSESGSVTFRTTVDPETISRVAPTVNVATIRSDETEPDDGEDSVTVTVEPPVLGGNPTPRPTPKPVLPDTATGFGIGGQSVTVPIELLAAFFIGSLGALALANVKARNRRR